MAFFGAAFTFCTALGLAAALGAAAFLAGMVLGRGGIEHGEAREGAAVPGLRLVRDLLAGGLGSCFTEGGWQNSICHQRRPD